MAQIGSFTRGDDGVFTGTIRTLNINAKATIKPVAKDNERGPDHRVTANGVEFGAGWSKAAKDTGAEYVSVKLDDPSFTGPGLRHPGPGREGRAQAHLVALTDPRRLAPREAPRPLALGIMRSATAPKPAETLGSRPAAPHNTSLRIIGPADIDAMAGGVVVGAVGLGDDADALGLDAEGDDLALELVADLLEGTDVGHVASPCCFRARDHRGLDGDREGRRRSTTHPTAGVPVAPFRDGVA